MALYPPESSFMTKSRGATARGGRLLVGMRRDGEEAPMRRPISPPTREAFNHPDLFIMLHTGVVEAAHAQHLSQYNDPLETEVV
jgi:hypothetical protein